MYSLYRVSDRSLSILYITGEEVNHMLTAYQCELCKRTCQAQPRRCEGCNYPAFTAIAMTAQEYCAQFGHDEGDVVMPGTAVYKGWHFETAAGEMGLPVEVRDYTHEHLAKCARCGREKKYRCQGQGH